MASDSWSDCARVTITAQAVTNVNLEFYTITESVNPEDGDRPVETSPVLCGGKVSILKPQEDSQVTLKLYPVLGFNPTTSGTGAGMDQLYYDTSTAVEAAKQYTITNASGTRKKFRVVMLWTDDSAATNAVGALDKTYQAHRVCYRNAYMTSLKRSFAAGEILSYDATFTIPAKQKDGTANIQIQSQVAGAAANFAVLSDYVSDTTGF